MFPGLAVVPAFPPGRRVFSERLSECPRPDLNQRECFAAPRSRFESATAERLAEGLEFALRFEFARACSLVEGWLRFFVCWGFVRVLGSIPLRTGRGLLVWLVPPVPGFAGQ